MARRSKRTQPEIAVGLAGSGKVPKKAAKEHLSEFMEAQDSEILWVLPYSTEVPKSAQAVVDFLWEEGAKYILVSDGTAEDGDLEEASSEVIEADEDAHVDEAVLDALLNTEAGEQSLIFLLDENSEADVALVEAAVEHGVVARDLCMGNQVLDVQDADEAPAEEAEDAEEDEPEEEEETYGLDAIPDEITDLINDGEFAEAGERLASDLGKDRVKELGAELGLDFKPNAWAKKVGEKIARHLAGDSEEEPEPEPKAAKKKSTKKKTEPKDETPEKEPEQDTEDRQLVAAAPMNGRANVDLLHILAAVTNASGVDEAREFLKFIREENLV